MVATLPCPQPPGLGGNSPARPLPPFLVDRLGQFNDSKNMTKKRAFISFDFDHDGDLRTLLAGQAKHSDTPFDIKDNSIKEALVGDWKEKVRRRMNNIDVVIVICGQYTHTATGVAAELTIAREEGKPYFLLWGRSDKTCTKPSSAYATDKIYKWTWDNLKVLIHGTR